LRQYICPLAVALLCIASVGSLIQPVQAKQTITCGALADPVTIDGKWTTSSEWNDAFEMSIAFVKGSGEAYFKAKHDQNYLYALVDFVSDTASQANDWAAIAMDVNNDGGATPQTDDLIVMGRWNSATDLIGVMTAGTGTAWGSWGGLTTGFKVASSTDAGNDPYSASSHLIYEFQVPMSKLNPSGTGIEAVASDREENMGAWPLNPMEVPSGFAYMTYSTEVLPEFSMVALTLPLPLAAAVLVLRFTRRRSVSGQSCGTR
jgi:hypothetical protein